MTAFRIPLDEKCARLRYYVSNGNYETFWELTGPKYKGLYSSPLAYRDNLPVSFLTLGISGQLTGFIFKGQDS